jgi:hypothetical protein
MPSEFTTQGVVHDIRVCVCPCGRTDLLTAGLCRFHNAQTIGLSTVLGLATLFLTWRPLLLGPSPLIDRYSLELAAFTGSAYWLTGLTAIYFPEADGLDPEFGGPGFPQRPIFLFFMTAGLAGSYLELR